MLLFEKKWKFFLKENVPDASEPVKLDIPERKFEQFSRAIQKLNKTHAVRAGVEPFSYSVEPKRVKDVTFFSEREAGMKKERVIVVPVTITGGVIGLETKTDWDFIGTPDMIFVDGGVKIKWNLDPFAIQKYGEAELLSELTKKYTKMTTCDYCNTNRDRVYFYTFKNKGDGRLYMVGSNCVKFLYPQSWNGEQLKKIFHLKSEFIELIKYTSSPEEWKPGGAAGTVDVNVKDFLAVAVDVINESGYLNAENHEKSSGNVALGKYNSAVDKQFAGQPEHLEKFTLDPKISQKVEKIIEWALSFPEEMIQTSSYRRNLQILASATKVSSKNANYLASMIPTFDKENSQKASDSVDPNKYAPGQKISNIEAELVDMKDFYGQYGTTTLYKFRTPDGYIFSWFTKNAKYKNAPERSPKLSDKLSLAATVKAYNEKYASFEILRASLELDSTTAAAFSQERDAKTNARRLEDAKSTTVRKFNPINSEMAGYAEAPYPPGSSFHAKMQLYNDVAYIFGSNDTSKFDKDVASKNELLKTYEELANKAPADVREEILRMREENKLELEQRIKFKDEFLAILNKTVQDALNT